MTSFLFLTDFYKVDHRRQYPPGTDVVYSNLTPRASRNGTKRAVFFGLQYFLDRYLGEIAHETFFDRTRSEVVKEYRRLLDRSLGPNNIELDHITDLHDLGYLPLEFCALPEGTEVPLRVPMLTVENTNTDFHWLTNYIETMMSCVMWLPITSATTAREYRRILDRFAGISGNPGFVDWQAHDFSFRGMACPEAAALSGAGHLLSFYGTDTIPAIQLLEDYYHASADELIGGSVPATEHSVMCAGGLMHEYETFARLLELYPSGIVSVVSDTWNLWEVINGILPALKSRILARDGKLVIRPDSGDPVKILTGCDESDPASPEGKGVIQLLWEQFGGQQNVHGFWELDPHIGAIYGDSITLERAAQICARLNAKGFASTNVVLGVGSYSYNYTTRDVLGLAVKSTWASIHGQGVNLFKDPVTDNGIKRSATGRLAVVADNVDGLRLIDSLTRKEQEEIPGNLLRPVWRNGEFKRVTTLENIRMTLKSNQGY